MYKHKLIEDNAGILHLAVLDGDNCIYYLADSNRKMVMEAAQAVKEGYDPISDEWGGGESNPQECYISISSIVEKRNGGAWEIE